MALETEMDMMDRGSRLKSSYKSLMDTGAIGDRTSLSLRYQSEESKNKKNKSNPSNAEGTVRADALQQEDFPGGFF